MDCLPVKIWTDNVKTVFPRKTELQLLEKYKTTIALWTRWGTWSQKREVTWRLFVSTLPVCCHITVWKKIKSMIRRWSFRQAGFRRRLDIGTANPWKKGSVLMSPSKCSSGKNEIKWHNQSMKSDSWELEVAYGKFQGVSWNMWHLRNKYPACSTSLSEPERWCGLVKKEHRLGNPKTQKQDWGPGLTHHRPVIKITPLIEPLFSST